MEYNQSGSCGRPITLGQGALALMAIRIFGKICGYSVLRSRCDQTTRRTLLREAAAISLLTNHHFITSMQGIPHMHRLGRCRGLSHEQLAKAKKPNQ